MSSVQAQAVSGWGRPRQRRTLRAAYATGLHGQTRDCSPRQLPTNHDHDGEPCARSTNIRVINRRHALPRLLFTCAWIRIRGVRKRLRAYLTGRSISGSRIAILAISVWPGSILRCALQLRSELKIIYQPGAAEPRGGQHHEMPRLGAGTAQVIGAAHGEIIRPEARPLEGFGAGALYRG